MKHPFDMDGMLTAYEAARQTSDHVMVHHEVKANGEDAVLVLMSRDLFKATRLILQSEMDLKRDPRCEGDD